MNIDEQNLIDGLFARLKEAEHSSGPRDAQAEARIREHVAAQPAVAYYMAQSILVQEAAIKRLDEQNKQLQAQLEQARQQQAESKPASSGGFLSGLFGGGSREPQPASRPVAPPPSSGGWREQAPSYNAQPMSPPPAYSPPPGYGQPQPQQPSATRSFMTGALQTAAGVAGGVMLAEGISSLFHHNSQPQEIVEIIKEEPAPAADNGGWGNEPERYADNGWNDQGGGFADSDYDGGGSFFDDDDTFV